MRHVTRHNKRDAVEPSILQALARLAVPVYEGPPLDFWCWLGRWVPVEVKSGTRGRFTDGQREFIELCEVYERPCLVWRSSEEAIKSVKEWRAKA